MLRHTQTPCFNSIKVRLKHRLALPIHTAVGFQFHKGPIKALRDNTEQAKASIVSIP